MRNDGQVKQELLNARRSMRQKFVFIPFQRMLHQKDRQNRLPFFYRNNIQKRGGIVPNIVPHIVPNIVPHIVPNIVPIELQKPLFCAAVGKEKVGTFFAFDEK